MSFAVDVLQAQIMSLPNADRARLLDRIIASLDVDVEAEAQWEALVDERDAELESGAVAPVPLEDAMARLRARFPG